MSRKASSAPEWKFSKFLGERNPAEEVLDVDIISAIEFDKSGKYLATGDNGGRIVLFEQTNEKDTDFESHEPEFDYLRSLEIGEKINKVRWCVTPNDSLFILSANDRTIKLWKLWDLRMEASPVEIFKIHEYLRPKLCDLYNSDSIFDKFRCCLSRDGLYFASGSYSNLFRIFSLGAGSEGGITLEASKIPNRLLQTAPKAVRTLSNFTRGHSRQGHDILNSENVGFPCYLNAKLLHLAWHPTITSIACAAANSLYMYYV